MNIEYIDMETQQNYPVCLMQPEIPQCNEKNCENFTFQHCSMFSHLPREIKCKYFPCKLLHDLTHLLNYAHHKQYEQIATHNFSYNEKLPIYMKDIWNTIHKNIINRPHSLHIVITEEHIRTIRALICTSKIFRILINVQSLPIEQYDNCTDGSFVYYRDTMFKCNRCNTYKHSCTCADYCHECHRSYGYSDNDSY